MTNQLRLILDDNASDFVYSGGEWTLSTLVQWYSRTSNYPAFASSTAFGSFSLTFEGTQVAFIGNTPTPDFLQWALVTIDGGSVINTTYGNLQPPAYVQWYQSPVLPDGKHTIKVDHLDGTSVDMAIISVGENTSLANKVVFVDDLDSAIQYSGSWVQDTGGFNAGTLPDGLPIGKTTHRSSTVGDTITLRFTGTSVALYGIFSWANLGLLAASFTLDGHVVSQTYPVTATSPEHVSADGEAINFVFYSNTSIPAGDHTLVMNITEVDGITFILDYITYTPSFATLATMPNLTAGASSSSGAPSSTTSPTSQSATSIFTSSNSPPSTSSIAQVGQNNSTSKNTPIGAIVGGVVGGVALIVLAVALFFWLRRERPVDEAETARPFEPKTNSSRAPQVQDGLSSTWRSNPSATSNDSLTPFPNSTQLSSSPFSSMADLKRGRGGATHGIQASMSEPRSSTNDASVVAVHPNSQVGSEPAGYIPESGPPAYDALPGHRGV